MAEFPADIWLCHTDVEIEKILLRDKNNKKPQTSCNEPVCGVKLLVLKHLFCVAIYQLIFFPVDQGFAAFDQFAKKYFFGEGVADLFHNKST